MFVLKFVPTMYDKPALQVLIGYFTRSHRSAEYDILQKTRSPHCNFLNTIKSEFIFVFLKNNLIIFNIQLL